MIKQHKCSLSSNAVVPLPSFKKKGGDMGYNHAKEQKKWKAWKEKEEQLLRDLNVSESKITELREYDQQVFKSERNFKQQENITDMIFFKLQPDSYQKQITNINDLLDSIENEALYEILNEQDEVTLKILLLRIHGYSVKEVSSILGINVRTVFRKIKNLKRNF